MEFIHVIYKNTDYQCRLLARLGVVLRPELSDSFYTHVLYKMIIDGNCIVIYGKEMNCPASVLNVFSHGKINIKEA